MMDPNQTQVILLVISHARPRLHVDEQVHVLDPIALQGRELGLVDGHEGANTSRWPWQLAQPARFPRTTNGARVVSPREMPEICFTPASEEEGDGPPGSSSILGESR
jgi:hypothetical protein